MAKIDRFLAKASAHIDHGELIHAAVLCEYPVKQYGHYDSEVGVLMALKYRLLMYIPMPFSILDDKVIGEPYTNIRSVELTRDTKGHRITLNLFSLDGAVAFRHIKDVIGAQELVTVIQQQLGNRVSPSSRGEKDSVPEKLRQLADLHTAGILTDTEYASKKAELLEQM